MAEAVEAEPPAVSGAAFVFCYVSSVAVNGPSPIIMKLILSALLLLPAAAHVWSAPAKPTDLRQLLKVEAAIITDAANGKRLAGFAENDRREVASLQKLLTALLIVRAGDLDKPVTITAADASCPPTKLPGSVGGTYTRRQLLEAVMVKSANDAARALARDHSGSETAFAAEMTRLARSLGAKNSLFKTSSGLPAPGQYSTVADMAIVTQAVYRDPLLRQIARKKSIPWKDASGKMHELRNSNRLLHRHENCGGMKIGFTGVAGHCAAIVWEENNRALIGVVAGGRDQMFWLQKGLALKLFSHGLL